MNDGNTRVDCDEQPHAQPGDNSHGQLVVQKWIAQTLVAAGVPLRIARAAPGTDGFESRVEWLFDATATLQYWILGPQGPEAMLGRASDLIAAATSGRLLLTVADARRGMLSVNATLDKILGPREY